MSESLQQQNQEFPYHQLLVLYSENALDLLKASSHYPLSYLVLGRILADALI